MSVNEPMPVRKNRMAGVVFRREQEVEWVPPLRLRQLAHLDSTLNSSEAPKPHMVWYVVARWAVAAPPAFNPGGKFEGVFVHHVSW
ncbi:uncharacterized protein SPSK_10164 [Sporothrix schenckii 1099-18]|uniref:Uncharacterized protein n=1 Tax=Sporothrix schenckii 1099-18 TaxID=1397361 RepID=A0A0F2M682_SPOSC|nr:uncharacterized protein SPSK_10164 [Sporothrix schenckii 1099-18]KJR84310.1 hypothetical protein SPSK_10164 [Sporothrix schenckii 1099-18]